MHTTKDLVDLLQLLQASRQNGDLVIEPLVKYEATWQGRFRFVDGQVTSCRVYRKGDKKVLLHDDKALRWLTNPEQGRLEWFLEEVPSLSDTFLPLLPMHSGATRDEQKTKSGTNFYLAAQNKERKQNMYSSTSDSEQALNTPLLAQDNGLETVFRRTKQGNLTPRSLPSRDHRQVFALIDGHRTMEEIMRLLNKMPDLVSRVLNDLKAEGLIE